MNAPIRGAEPKDHVMRKVLRLGLAIAVGGGISISGQASVSAVGCVSPQWTDPAAATNAFANVQPGPSGERWLAGDGGWTVVHPGTCNRLHIFGDSAVTNAAGQRVMPSGNALLQTPALPGQPSLRFISGARPMIPDGGDGSRSWPGPAVYDNNRLYSFTSHIRPIAGTSGWDDLGKNLAEFTWDGNASLRYVGEYVTPSTGRPWKDSTGKYAIAWGAAVLKHGNYIYIYGTYREDGWFGHRVFLARVPSGQLPNVSAWRYFNGTGYTSNDERTAKAIISEFGGPESSFSVYALPGPVFRVVSKKDGTFGDTVQRWSSSLPSGPWTTTPLFSMPWVETDQTYLVTAHGNMRYADGRVPITVSHGRGSSGSLAEMWDNPARYRNTWHGAPA